uniref:Uncharacterized protein n=1 Tax=viral metagenome TaxID=1070528 RepID=A0A6C0IY14_9ZZZZ
MSDDYEDETGSIPTDEDLSEDEFPEEAVSGEEDFESSEEESGYSLPVSTAGQFWKAPISGVSISFGGQAPAPQSTSVNQQPLILPGGQMSYAPQPSFVPQISSPQAPLFEIIPSASAPAPVVSAPTQQQPITFNTVGRNFIVRWLPNYLTPYQVPLINYRSYLENLRGKYDEATGTWTFSRRNEAQVRDLLTRITTGQLPPPDQLALPNLGQASIDMSAISKLPTRTAPPPTMIGPEPTPSPAPPPSTTYTQAPAPTPAPSSGYLPSQIIQATMPTLIVPPSPQVAVTEAPQIPPYDPTTKEASESQEEYDRRMMLYRHLMGYGIPSSDADRLARMRNQVDIHGVSYEPAAMQILNTYLPLAQ